MKKYGEHEKVNGAVVNNLIEENEKIKRSFDDVIWMALRYAHGKHNYAPSMVRDAVKVRKELNDGWDLRKDITVKPPNEDVMESGFSLRSDYLDDLLPLC